MKGRNETVGRPELRPVPAASFRMGNDAARSDERPAHAVTLAPFRAAPRPVSNAEYARFVAATGGEPPPFLGAAAFADLGLPAVGVSWFEAVAYCDWLAAATGLPLRLPSEAEREWAALGGLEAVDWPWGDEAPAVRPELVELRRGEAPHLPTALCANGYGLLCMADNVHEWCSDWYDAAYYGSSPLEVPPGPAAGKRRASRGGSWRHAVKFNRISSRSSLDPSYRYNDYGFRVYADGDLVV